MAFENNGWQREFHNGIKTVEELEEFLPLGDGEKEQLSEVIRQHPMLVSRYYLSLINTSDPADPLRKMMVPSAHELDMAGLYDTSGELNNTRVKGLQHKYRQTALVLATSICAGYCRYCFRKRLVGRPSDEIVENIDAIVDYITGHPEINNVLISGGDPLILQTATLEKILDKLAALPQLSFIRIGSKVPVVLPRRILEDKDLQALLKRHSLPHRRLYIITQFNHPREVTEQAEAAVNSLISAGCIISNQTTLLKGVNDNAKTLAALMTKLSSIGDLPYYIFQCRPVKRVRNYFQLPLHRGIEIVENAKSMLNGQAKRFKYAMSHETGKIEIIGKFGKDIFFKYHQAKNPGLSGVFFKTPLEETAGWLESEDLPLPN